MGKVEVVAGVWYDEWLWSRVKAEVEAKVDDCFDVRLLRRVRLALLLLMQSKEFVQLGGRWERGGRLDQLFIGNFLISFSSLGSTITRYHDGDTSTCSVSISSIIVSSKMANPLSIPLQFP